MRGVRSGMADQSFAEMRFADFLGAVAAKSPAPGGGAVASSCGALAAALAQMVVNYSLGKKNLEAHQPALKEAVGKLERARALLLELAREDAAAYSLLNELQKLPESDPRRSGLAEAQLLAVRVPQSVAAAGVDLLVEFESLAGRTNRFLRSDLGIAAVLAEATVRSAVWNVRINAMERPDRKEIEAACDGAITKAAEICRRVERACAV